MAIDEAGGRPAMDAGELYVSLRRLQAVLGDAVRKLGPNSRLPPGAEPGGGEQGDAPAGVVPFADQPHMTENLTHAPGPLGPGWAPVNKAAGPPSASHRQGARGALMSLGARMRQESARNLSDAGAIAWLLTHLPVELPEHVEVFLHEVCLAMERRGRS